MSAPKIKSTENVQELTQNAQDYVSAQHYLAGKKAPLERKELLQKDNAALGDAALKTATSAFSLFMSPGKKSANARFGAFLMASASLLTAVFKAAGDSMDIPKGDREPKNKPDKTVVADNENKTQGPGVKTGTAGAFDQARNPASPSMTAVDPKGNPVGAAKPPAAAPGSTAPGPATMEAA